MRSLEILLVLVAAVAVLWPLIRPGRMVAAVLAGAAALAAALQVGVEGGRWQLVPIYALVAMLLVWRVVRLGAGDAPRHPWLTGVAGGLVLVLSAALAVLLPVPPTPAPDGEHAIGTTSWVVTDPARDEVYGDATGPRTVVAQAWYPTTTAGPDAPWVSDAAAFSDALTSEIGIPSFALRHTALIKTYAALDVPIAEGDWPLVVYSHGWGGFRTAQSDLIEQLASHGFVVVALDHTYGAAVTLFPDSTDRPAIPLDPTANPTRAEVGGDAYVDAITLLEQTFAADVAVTLDQISAGDAPSQLGSVDTDQVGLIGHSTGGGAMIRLCITDDRCAGVLGFDPWVEPVPADLLDQGLDTPVLSIRSEEWQGNNNDQILRAFHDRATGSEGMEVIPGSIHTDFTVKPFLTPLAAALGQAGPIDPQVMHQAINAAALDFVDRHLRDGPGVDVADVIQPD